MDVFFVVLDHSFYFLIDIVFFLSDICFYFFKKKKTNIPTMITLPFSQGGTWTVGTRTIWT